jgi:hypothetical protein
MSESKWCPAGKIFCENVCRLDGWKDDKCKLGGVTSIAYMGYCFWSDRQRPPQVEPTFAQEIDHAFNQGIDAAIAAVENNSAEFHGNGITGADRVCRALKSDILETILALKRG